MFGLGPTELLVILVLALLVLGPQKIPEVASTLGKAIRSFRKVTRELRDQIDIDDEVRRPLEDLRSALRDEPPPPPPRNLHLMSPPAPVTGAPLPAQPGPVVAAVTAVAEPAELPVPGTPPAAAPHLPAPAPAIQPLPAAVLDSAPAKGAEPAK